MYRYGGVRGLYVAKLIQKIEKKKGIYFKDYFEILWEHQLEL